MGFTVNDAKGLALSQEGKAQLIVTSFLKKNILHKRVALLTLLSHKVAMKYLSSTLDPIIAEQIYMMPELCRRYQRIFIQ